MADDYTPKLGTKKAFEDVHPPGNGNPEDIQVGDRVRDELGLESEVVGVFGDFARLQRGAFFTAQRRSTLTKVS